MRSTWFPALAAVLLAGCASSGPRAPYPESMEPASAREGERTAVTIRGSDFYLEVKASYLKQERSYLSDTFTARLGEVELEEVTYVSFSTLEAVVPERLEQGVYDLTVRDPEGREGVLRDAFEVLPPEQVGGCDPESAAEDDRTCDGKDDDCDGETDEDYEPVATNCGVGACAAVGETSCEDGALVDSCVEGSPEADDTTCDNVDDDCDGETDEDYEPVATSCGVGACAGNTGEIACSDGVTEDTCDPYEGAAADDTTCDGVDDDCDDDTDEDYVETATSCGVGACAASGVLSCVDGTPVDSCIPGSDAASDDPTCDGIDEDCDGETDEDYEPVATVCGVGACAGNTGEIACSDGVTEDTCDPFQGAAGSDGDCDNSDDDCDGSTDEEYTPPPTSCGVGACAASGTLSCVAGTPTDSCVAGTPAPGDADCDNIDDDCDGSTDEEYTPTPTSCGVGACAGNTGEIACSDGATEDTCDPYQGAAADDTVCDGVDEDCDGSTDEEYTPTPTSCGVGACAGNTGDLVCSGGTPIDTCDPYQGAAADDTFCDGVDEDCDGSTDEEYTPTPTSCGVGACSGNTGNLICSGGTPTDTCDPYQGAAADDTTCDNIDDDCDGSTDEEYTPTPTSCGVGACAGNTGEIACSDGVTDDTCDPFQGAVNESESNGNCSDSTDNDCDGLTDGDDPSCGVIANTPPVAAFVIDPPAGTTATVFQADADGSTDLEDDPASLTYMWDWDNDGVTDDEGINSSHTFVSEGAHTVTLMVEDTGGLRGYATFEVIVAPTDELITVTTQLDEEDSGATPSSPGGTGLSLREAIIYANGRADKQTVFVPSGYVIGIVDTLPNSTDASGLDVVADGAALDGSGTNPNEACIQLNTSDTRFYGLEIFNCGGVGAQFIGGSNNRVARCYIHDNEVGVYISGSGNFFGPDNEVTGNVNAGVHVAGANTVEFNRVHGNPARGIFLGGGAAGSTVRGNTVYQNGTDGIFVANQADDSVIVHNTVHDNTSSGVYIGGSASGIDFRNNILSQNGAWGVFADDDNFLYRDYNNYYLNASGTCAWCSSAEPNSLSDEPLYIDTAGFDFRLRDDSPLIDQGVVIPGIDLNRAEPGDYNGSYPDIGAWEAP